MSPVWPTGTPWRPKRAASSSASEKGTGSITWRLSLPSELRGELLEQLLHALGVAAQRRLVGRRLGRRSRSRG